MDFAAARRNMVECQLRTNQVTDAAVLSAMGALPRERFVPEPLTTIAYIDEDLDIGNGRFLTEPMVLGRLLQAMAPQPEYVAMCIGCGTGYAVAVLSRLCGAVFALESDTELATRASVLLSELGIDNAFLVEGALEAGWRKEAPYNVILFDGAVSEVPRDVLDQLADGGRLAAVIQSASGMGTATLLEKRHGQISRRVLFDAQIPVLSGFEPKANFVF